MLSHPVLIGVTMVVLAILFVASPPLALTALVVGAITIRRSRRNRRERVARLLSERQNTWGY